MKIFLSWSGEQSRQVAEIFSDWIQCVIQACRPWISTRDIERGSIWFAEISEQIKDVTLGVVFLTRENKEKPWILFESGALAKGLTNSRVCTFLIDVEPGEIDDPLAQFNHTLPTKKSIYGLVRTLNASSIYSIEEKVLENILNTYWPQFEASFNKIKADFADQSQSTAASTEDSSEVLKDILNSLRTLGSRMARIEAQNKDMTLERIGSTLESYPWQTDKKYHLKIKSSIENIARVQKIIDSAYELGATQEELKDALSSHQLSKLDIDRIVKYFLVYKGMQLHREQEDAIA